MSDKLRPCQRCGSERITITGWWRPRWPPFAAHCWRIHRDGESMEIGPLRLTKAGAARAWDRRASDKESRQ